MMYKTETTLYKDANGNLWYYEGKEDNYHKVVVVDYEDGQYIFTHITWYMTDKELAECTKVHIYL